jgi:hypothetical protein
MSAHSSEELEAIQNVVDRVTSYQDGAPPGTVESELLDALAEAGLQVNDDDLKALVAAIDEDPGDVRAAAVLGR